MLGVYACLQANKVRVEGFKVALEAGSGWSKGLLAEFAVLLSMIASKGKEDARDAAFGCPPTRALCSAPASCRAHKLT